MPILKSFGHNSLPQSSLEKRLPNIQQARGHFSVEDFKAQYDKIMAKISNSDVKKWLKSSPSDSNFYSDICREELKKLEQEKYSLEKKIHIETEINKKKDAEAARIVKKLWEETEKTNSSPRSKKTGNKKGGLKPEDVKKIWAEAKRLSNQSRQKKKKLVAQKKSLDSKIHLAKEAIKLCYKLEEKK